MGCRVSRDAMSSLHLFCGAIASEELANQHNRIVEIYLHSGSFCIPLSFIGMKAGEIVPELTSRNDTCEEL